MLSLIVTGAFIVAFGLVASPPSALERATINFIAALPGFLSGVWGLVWTVLPAWALALLGASLLRRRFRTARDIVVAALTSLVAAALTATAIGDQRGIAAAIGASAPPSQLSPIRLAVAGAAILVAAPQLSRPFRRLGRWLVSAAALSALLLGVTTPSGAILGLLVAAGAAAATRLVFGSADGRPSLGDVRRSLRQLGIDTDEGAPASRQTSGVFVARVRRDQEWLQVKVYGRDAYDTQFVAKVWRALWYRHPDTSFGITRLQQVEHEAFVLLYAASRGVPVPAVVTAGVSADHDALLVLRGDSAPLRDLAPSTVDGVLLAEIWETLGLLHDAGIVHGSIDIDSIGYANGAVTLRDLSGASVISSDEGTLADVAQLYVSTVVVAGQDGALGAARTGAGDDQLARALPYVQDAALTIALRRTAKAAHVDIEQLRTDTARALGVELGQPVRLRRVSRGGLIRAALLSLGAYALLSAFGGVDLAELGDALRNANWAWLVFGLFVGQTPRLTQAASTRTASPEPIPYGPVYALQLAVSFVNLAIPSTIARVAVNIRFFQRQGLRAAMAVAIGALDSMAEFLVQASLLVIALLTGAAGINLQLDASSTGNAVLALLGAVLLTVAAAGVVLAFVRSWRQRVFSKLREWYLEVRTTIASLSAVRVAQLIAWNLTTQVLFALTLSIFLAAFGTTLPLITVIVVNVTAALLAGLLPIPGGIGVTEGALIYGLTAAGVADTTAFAAVMSYRIATFYLPPIWGAFAFRWLERNRYL